MNMNRYSNLIEHGFTPVPVGKILNSSRFAIMAVSQKWISLRIVRVEICIFSNFVFRRRTQNGEMDHVYRLPV